MVPTLRTGASLRRSDSSAKPSAYNLKVDAERRGLHSHADRGNDQKLHAIDIQATCYITIHHGNRMQLDNHAEPNLFVVKNMAAV